MTSKRIIQVWFVSIVIFSLILMGINFIIDPFQQYRVKTFYPIHYSNTRYKNAGFAKNFEYTSIILGTSMSQNFILSKTERLLNFKKLLKLCIPGGSAREQSLVLNTAIEHNKKLSNVLWGLDIASFFGHPTRLRYGENSMPFHLYDQNLLNDYKYLFSFDTLQKSFQAYLYQFVKNKNDIRFNYDLMDQWQHLHKNDFKEENVLKHWNPDVEIKNQMEPVNHLYNLKRSFEYNFLKLIKENEQINFKIFFPPYSILYFKNFERQNTLKDVLAFKRYVYERIGSLSNVEIYDFQIEKQITHNLNNYKDLNHYHQKINHWMIEKIKEKEYLLTSRNIDSYIKNLQEQTRVFEYEMYTERLNIKNEKNIDSTK